MCKPYCAFCLKTVYLFIFGCAGSLLVWAFSSCSEWGLLSSCGAQSSHCGGFSCYRAQALGHTGFSSCDVWVWLPHACEIFLDSGSNLCSLHWQVDFSPLDLPGKSILHFLKRKWLTLVFFFPLSSDGNGSGCDPASTLQMSTTLRVCWSENMEEHKSRKDPWSRATGPDWLDCYVGERWMLLSFLFKFLKDITATY